MGRVGKGGEDEGRWGRVGKGGKDSEKRVGGKGGRIVGGGWREVGESG